MKVVSVINHKGGVGKTTLTANLGAGLAARGRRVLLVDLDAQASLTVSFFTYDEWLSRLLPDRTIRHWFDGVGTEAALSELAPLISSPPQVIPVLAPTGGYLDLIAAHRELGDLEIDLAAELRLDPTRYLASHRRLREGLGQPGLAEYDVVLVDCAPNFGMLARNAVTASDLLLIPTRPDYLSTNGIDSLAHQVRSYTAEYNARVDRGSGRGSPRSEGPPQAVVFTMVQFYGSEPIASQRSYMSRVEALGIPTFDSVVRENKSVYGPSPEHGVPVVLGGAGRGLTRELRELVDELATRLERIRT